MAPVAAYRAGGPMVAAAVHRAHDFYKEAWEDGDDEEDDEKTLDLSWIDGPWTEMEDVEWCGRDCCRATPVATHEAARAAPMAVETGALTVRDEETMAALVAAQETGAPQHETLR
jgi:hypothetical protein